MPPITIIKIRRDVSNRWREINPVLADGEPGFERDTGNLKIGDGVTPWNDLIYRSVLEPGTPLPSEPELPSDLELIAHIYSDLPHPVYDDGPSLALLYQNAKV